MKEKTIAIIIWIAIYGFASVGIYNLFNWLIWTYK